MQLVAGVDSSTQSTKVEIRALESGELIATGRASHPEVHPPVSEQDPESWWRALAEAMGQVPDIASDVVAVSVVGQQHGLVCLDDAGASLRPAKLWNDTTSADQARSLVASLGAEEWARRCGLVPVASITITKLAWLVQNEPDIVARAAAFMLPHDYLTWKLTGNLVTDRGDASGTGWWSPITGRYEPELLALVVDHPDTMIDRLPAVLGPREMAGRITAEAAAATGLTEGIPVACGSGDNMGAAYGFGLEPGDVAMSLGTSGTVYAVTTSAVADQTGSVAGFADATGRYLPLVATLNATRVTDTVAHWLGADVTEFAELALEKPPDPQLVLKPYFDGERTPNLPNAKGFLTGIDNDTTRSDIAAVAHIGVVCGLLHGLEALEHAGVIADGCLHLTGGGARSAAYQQWVADLSGRPVEVHLGSEATATGACRQAAAVATGRETKWFTTPAKTVEPHASIDRIAYLDRYRTTVT